MSADRYAIDWRFSAYPTYPAEADAWAAIVRRNCPNADDAAVFMGAHCAMILSRSATGRDGLALLEAWSSPRLADNTVGALIRKTMRWHSEATRRRRDTLRRLGHILSDVEHELKRGGVDPAAVAAEADELRAELESRAESPADPAPFAGLFAWAPSGRAVRALRRALQAYRRAWPWRKETDALDTLAKVRAARHVRVVKP